MTYIPLILYCMSATQSCLTLSDPADCSPPGSSVHGYFQARILEWVAISFSRDLPHLGIEPGSPALQADALPSELLGKPQKFVQFSFCIKVAQLCPTLCDLMEFSRPEYWSGQPFPSPGHLPHPGIEPRSPALQADSVPAEPQGKPPHCIRYYKQSKDELKYSGGYAQVICKYYAILYKDLSICGLWNLQGS